MVRKFILLLLILNTHFTTWAQFELNGSAIQTSGNCYQLTPEQNFTVGTAWATQMVSLNDSFNLSFEIYLGNKDNNGADGMVFGLQPVSTSAGNAGVGIGFGGIVPSLGIEFDTYQNSFDPAFDHVAIIRDGEVNHTQPNTLFGPVQMDPFDINTEDGQTHLVQIIWDPTAQQMQVFFDCNLIVDHSFANNIVNDIFGGSPLVHWGFTSATGGLNNIHSFCLVSQNFVNQTQEVTICDGDTIQLSYTGGQNYSWTPTSFISDSSASSPLFFPQDSTEYIVQISDSCGNTWTDTARVYPVAPPTLSLGADTFLCDTSFELTANHDPFNLIWSTGDTTDSITIDSSSTIWLEASIDQCAVSDTIEIILGTPAFIDLGNDTTVCQGDTVILDISPFSYDSILWSSGLTDSILAITQAGNYQVTVSEDTLCPVTDSIEVSFVQNVAPNLGSDTIICETDTLSLSTGLNSSGLGFAWSSGSQDSVIQVTLAGTYIVEVSAGSCSGQDTVTVGTQPLPVFNLGNDTIICDTSDIELSIETNATTYLWSNGSTDFTSFFSPNNSTIIWGQATLNGCRYRDSLLIEIDTVLFGSLSADTTLCLGDTFQIPNTLPSFTGSNYQFFENTSDQLQSPNQPDTVWFFAENVCGSNTDTVLVSYYPPSNISLQIDSVYCFGENIVLRPQISSTLIDSISWSTGDLSDSILVSTPGIYTVTLSTTCEQISETVTLLFEDCTPNVSIPNIFSPNGDGVNDFFEIQGPEDQKYQVSIYNRWGQLLFYSSRPFNEWWHGRTFSGVEAVTGTYFYVLTGNDNVVYKGALTLTR